QEYGIRPRSRLLRRGGETQLGAPSPRSLHRLRVGGDDLRPQLRESHRDGQRRRIAPDVAVRLERQPPPREAPAGDNTTDNLTSEIDGALTAAQVDAVHLPQEAQRLVNPELLGARHEPTDVFRKAPATEPQPCVQEAAADARVVANRIRQLRDIRPG